MWKSASINDAPAYASMTRNLKIVLAYDGTPFSGWQVQPDRSTVQGELADAIARVTGERVLPQGSGRTDTGVHALAQVASCAIVSNIPLENLRRALNNTLPEEVRVIALEEAAPDFHARHSAQWKSYRYRIFRGELCPPFLAHHVYAHPYPLDEKAMVQAAQSIVGEHDFTSFAAVDPDKSHPEGTAGNNNVRTVFSSTWSRHGEELVYEVTGSGFLHHMVRNLVGTFLLVGKGTLAPGDISRILQARDRSTAGATAPGHGLYLVEVGYEPRGRN